MNTLKTTPWIAAAFLLLGCQEAGAQNSILSDSTPPTASKAGGIGAGNGTPDARDAYLARLRAEMAPNSRVATTPDEIGRWCSTVGSILRREEKRANVALFNGNRLAAKQILVDALVAAGSSLSVDTPPMTKTVIDRGLKSLLVLDEKLGDQAPLHLATKLNFIAEYYHLVYQVIADYDRPYYIPYRYRYGGCPRGCPPEFDIRGFERIAVQIAAQQLEMATRLTELDDRGRVVPVGSPVAFLSVAQMASGFSAEDLENGLFAYSNACVIAELHRLSESLWSYLNTGDTTIYPNLPYAVTDVRVELDSAISRIRDGLRGCNSRY